MKVFLSSLWILFIISVFVPHLAGASRRDSLFQVGRSADELFEERWELLTGKKKIGILESIGGKPRILRIEKKMGPDQSVFWLLHYDSGSAGTSQISQLDRLAVIHEELKTKNFKLLLDLPVALRRYEGFKIQLELIRKVDWSSDSRTLMLGVLDEFPKSRYVWKNDAFVQVK